MSDLGPGCLRCGYSLSGLSERDRCPECGSTTAESFKVYAERSAAPAPPVVGRLRSRVRFAPLLALVSLAFPPFAPLIAIALLIDIHDAKRWARMHRLGEGHEAVVLIERMGKWWIWFAASTICGITLWLIIV